MEDALLHVIWLAPRSGAQVEDALRALRRACADDAAGEGAASDGGACGDGRTLLLFCDLPDADALKTPQDDALIRHLQSGVMAMSARRPGRFLLLVRRRAWDDAARAYLGPGQRVTPHQVIAQLLAAGQTESAFEAASFSPGSLCGRYRAVLFTRASLSCTPDTPLRMRRMLAASDAGCVRGHVLPRRAEPATVLARLMRQGFSLSPVQAPLRQALARRGLSETDGPLMFTAEALCRAFEDAPAAAVPCGPAEDCLFVEQREPTVFHLLGDIRARYTRALGRLPDLPRRSPDRAVRAAQAAQALLPIAQMALLALSAATGLSLPAFLAVVLPEAYALLHPRMLPGALVRTALLPIHAAISLDALFSRLLAHSRAFRFRLPASAQSAYGCVFCGAALLTAAFFSAQALVPLMAVSLLWLSAPLLIPALDSPTRERIPLSQEEHEQLLALAESAFYSIPREAHPALRMLADCAGCMLGMLEPDEAARRAQALLDGMQASPARLSSPKAVPRSAVHQAAMLASAQFLRERMADCDAALRPLPAQLEALVRAQEPSREDGLLAGLLRIARGRDSDAAACLQPSESDDPLSALFLPPHLTRPGADSLVTLPLTHPHTYLRRQLLLPAADQPSADGTARFLCLAAAALAHPFEALLWRSPIAAPYAPLLSIL